MKGFCKQALACFLAAVMLAGLLPVGIGRVTSLAAEDTPGGYGSNGKFLAPITAPVADSIPVSSVEDILAIKDNLRGSYHLTKDIDLAGIEWTPIGAYDKPFRGIFDGQGYVIKHLTITGMDSGVDRYQGVWGTEYNLYLNYSLFGYIQGGNTRASIRNLAVDDVSIDLAIRVINDNYFAAISPIGQGGTYLSNGYYSNEEIINCYTTGNIKIDVKTATEYGFGSAASGVVTSATYVEDCYNMVDIDIDMTSSNSSARLYAYACGIGAGHDDAQNGGDTVRRSFNMGNISVAASATGDSPSCIVSADGLLAGRVYDSYNAGNITTIARTTDTYPERNNSYRAYASSTASGISSGTMNSLSRVYNRGTITSEVYSNNTDYNVTPYACSLGIFPSRGGNNFVSLEETLFSNDRTINWYTSTVGSTTNCHEIDITTAADQSFWRDTLGFDFDTIWKMPEGGGFPIFKAQAEDADEDGAGDSDDEETDIEQYTINFHSDVKNADISFPVWWGVDYFCDNGYYSSEKYNQQLATTACALSAAAYGNAASDSSYIRTALETLGMENIKTYYDSSNPKDGIGFSISSKKGYEGSPDLIMVVVRGTEGNEWYGDFNIGTANTHSSFEKAKVEVVTALEHYILDNIVVGYDTMINHGEWKINTRPVKIMVTGHSRGAAVANLVAADLIDRSVEINEAIESAIRTRPTLVQFVGIEKINDALDKGSIFTNKNTYAYTFATPNVTTIPTAKSSASHKNIFNLVNAEDFVPFVPFSVSGWNYWKYGTTYAFPSGGMDGGSPGFRTPEIRNMRDNFKRMTDKDYEYYDDGYRAVQNFVNTVLVLAPTPYQYSNRVYSNLGAEDITPEGFFLDLIGYSMVEKHTSTQIAAYAATKYAIHYAFGATTRFFVNATKIQYAHAPETYLAWLQATSESDLLGRGEAPAVLARIACPVDIEVYSENNILVGKTVGDVPDESLYGEVSIYVIGDVKYVYMPATGGYTIRIEATAEGVMEYSVELFDVLSGQVDEGKIFSNITLTDGKTMQSKIGGNLSIADIQLLVLDDNNNPTFKIQTDGTEAPLGSTPNNTPGGGGSAPSAPSAPLVTSIPDQESPTTLYPEFINPFTDVSESDWFYNDVTFTYTNNIFKGTSATTFSPNMPMTRAMFVTVLWRISGESGSIDKSITFSDVPENMWYSDAVVWAAENSIVSGYGDGRFCPDDNITREQMSAILMRYASHTGKQITSIRQFAEFEDHEQIAVYARDAVAALYCGGIVNGKDSNTFDPKGDAARAEVAAVVRRFFEIP